VGALSEKSLRAKVTDLVKKLMPDREHDATTQTKPLV
jgi:hypothetical protein